MWGQTSTSRACPQPSVTAGSAGGGVEATPPPATLPGRGHDGARGEAQSNLLPVANVYRPTAQGHAANDALMVRGYKHMTSISRHGQIDALCGPWEHGCKV